MVSQIVSITFFFSILFLLFSNLFFFIPTYVLSFLYFFIFHFSSVHVIFSPSLSAISCIIFFFAYFPYRLSFLISFLFTVSFLFSPYYVFPPFFFFANISLCIHFHSSSIYSLSSFSPLSLVP